ncbi:MAG: M15 family metallopeptidase [Candidatus Bathyarchaeota archaeon]|nr:M15 family metallopeptidase [Candidatus Bathyarchaeota archaeon]
MTKEKYLIQMSGPLRDKYLAFDQKMNEAKIPYAITCVARTLVVQMTLFIQGRLGLEHVNKFRKAAELPPIEEKKNVVVTWTLESKHVVNPLDTNPEKRVSKAFDIVILKGKEPTWDLKVNVNENEVPDYIEAGQIGETVGLEWGGRWENPDYPHFQLKD